MFPRAFKIRPIWSHCTQMKICKIRIGVLLYVSSNFLKLRLVCSYGYACSTAIGRYREPLFEIGFFFGWAISRCLSTTPHPINRVLFEIVSLDWTAVLTTCKYAKHFILWSNPVKLETTRRMCKTCLLSIELFLGIIVTSLK